MNLLYFLYTTLGLNNGFVFNYLISSNIEIYCKNNYLQYLFIKS